MANELKPCPFCGAPARQSSGGSGSDMRFGTGCSGRTGCPASLLALAHTTQEKADVAWNSRRGEARRDHTRDRTAPAQHGGLSPTNRLESRADTGAEGGGIVQQDAPTDAELHSAIESIVGYKAFPTEKESPSYWLTCDELRALLARYAPAQDAERIDWLESQINEHGAIHLHDGNHPAGHGLGLRPGNLVRTLREAIDDARAQRAGKEGA